MKKLILFLFIFTGSINFTYAQWLQTNGPHTVNHITCIAVSGTNIFAGTPSGVFLSPDSGLTWIAVNNGLTDTIVTSLAISGTNIFAGTQDSGVFLSTDTGSSWTAVNNGLLITNVASLAAMGTKIFAGTLGNGIFLSTDTGSNWTAVINALSRYTVSALGVSGTNIFAGTLEGYLSLSTDTGSTWTEIDGGVFTVPVTSFAKCGTNIFVGTGGGVYLADINSPFNWTAVDSGLLNTNVNSLTTSGTNIFAGTFGGGIFLSTNTTGSNWRAVNNGLTDSTIFSLAVSETNIFAGTDTAGVWKSQLSDLLKCAPIINASSATNFPCGGSVTLSNSIGSGFLWSDGETTQSIVVTTAGNYSCNVTTGCGNIISNVITVNMLSIATISPGGATTFCQGDSVSVMLTADSASSYLWIGGETTQSIEVTATGNYACRITTNCGMAIISNIIFVTVNPLPVATITPGGDTMTLCQGEAATLTVSSGSSYLWSNGASTQSITVSAAGIDSVTMTDRNGCSATTATDVTTIYPLPSTPIITPGGATTFCEGDSVELISSSAAGYLWNNGATTQSITVKSSGGYSVIVINANGCSSANSSDTISVIIHSNPIPPTIHQSNDTLKSSSATNNQWYLNGNIISGATGQYYVVTHSGIYTVKLTNGNGCSSMSAPFNLVGIAELISDYSFSIYPNPAGNQLTVSDLKFTHDATLGIYNILGEQVYIQQLPTPNSQLQIVIDVSTLPAGMYFLQMKTESAIHTKRFIKE